MLRVWIRSMLCCLVVTAVVHASPELAGHWPLDEVIDGKTPDMSGNGNDLLLGGGADLVEGMYDQAIFFDGQDGNEDHIYSEADVDLFDPGAAGLTATAWIKAQEGTTSQTYQFVFGKGNATSGLVGWSIFIENKTAIARCNSSNTSVQRASQKYAGLATDEWVHLAIVIDRNDQQVRGYVNGSNEGWVVGGGGPTSDSLSGWGGIDTDIPFVIGQRNDGRGTFLGTIDDVRIYTGALTAEQIQAAMQRAGREQARGPAPADGAGDVPRDTALSWTPGEYAVIHDVYLGTVFEDVNGADRATPLGVLVNQGQAETTYNPESVLAFDQTYYWRVDEVNGAPDYTVFRGQVWSFVTEPVAYPIANVIATSNGVPLEGQGPEHLVDGSGLNDEDQHSISTLDMWGATAGSAEPLYVQFEFDRPQKLYEMLIWNYNMEFERVLGLGVKEATIEISQNGTDWTVFGDVEVAQATANAAYTHNTTISLAGVVAKYLRMTIKSNWGGSSPIHGLSEVRFLALPVYAREPEPADAATDVTIDTVLSWRKGRDTVRHEVYLSTDGDFDSPVATTTVANYDPGFLDLGAVYSWRIVEINDVDGSTWHGDVWQFSTEPFLEVEGFETYNDDVQAGGAIWQSWIDGIDDSTNGGGVVGYGQSPFAELSVVHSGRQSMPFFFDNPGPTAFSEADHTFDSAQDWSIAAIANLSLWFYGAEGNTGQLYARINGVKTLYAGESDDIATADWQPWTIDLATVGVDLSRVTTLSLGVEGAGAGVVYFDDIRLYP